MLAPETACKNSIASLRLVSVKSRLAILCCNAALAALSALILSCSRSEITFGRSCPKTTDARTITTKKPISRCNMMYLPWCVNSSTLSSTVLSVVLLLCPRFRHLFFGCNHLSILRQRGLPHRLDRPLRIQPILTGLRDRRAVRRLLPTQFIQLRLRRVGLGLGSFVFRILRQLGLAFGDGG